MSFLAKVQNKYLVTSDLHTETILLPDVMAEKIIEELIYMGVEQQEAAQAELVKHLIDRAEKTFTASADFRKKVKAKGNAGHDSLYSFMRHWASAYIKKHDPAQFKKISQGFSVGKSPL